MKYLGLEIYNLRIQSLAAKMAQFYLKILPFASSISLYRINFSVSFSIEFIHIKKIFKRMSHFFLLLRDF